MRIETSARDSTFTKHVETVTPPLNYEWVYQKSTQGSLVPIKPISLPISLQEPYECTPV